MPAMFLCRSALAIAALASVSAPAVAAVTYTFTGEYVSERDDQGNTLATSTATWTYTAADFVTSATSITPDSCDTGNANFTCDATQRMEPYPTSFGNEIGADYVGFNFLNNGGGGTGFYWFQPGAFSLVGTHSNAGWPNPACDSAGNCYGNAGVATLVVSQSGNAVPEPATWALVIGGLGLVGVVSRRKAGSATRLA